MFQENKPSSSTDLCCAEKPLYLIILIPKDVQLEQANTYNVILYQEITEISEAWYQKSVISKHL